MKKEWRVFWDPSNSDFEENLKIARQLSISLGVSEFLAKLLVSRGITCPNEAKKFLNPDLSMVIDPFVLKDMDKAVEILLEIRKNKEKILVFGDYDVDGVTSSAVIYLGLTELGFDVEAYIPSRMDEGYSLNMDAISDFEKKGYKNIITVDCGTSSIQEIEFAKSRGMKIIVTDHHETQEVLPIADAIVNPKRKDSDYPFKGLAGVGVAFKVLLALSSSIETKFDPYQYIDLVAIGTIADIVPILSENRYFVKKGLEKLRTKPLKGIEGLLKELKIMKSEIKSHIIAYKVAPKINAAGRMADAETAFKLLISKDNSEINKYVNALIKLNSKRQAKEKEIYLYALSLMDVNHGYHEDKVLVLSGENWHLGVLGIVASKLSSQFNKPVLMISKETPFGKGSARSPQGINLINIFKSTDDKEIFNEFGGHELAAGFSVDFDKIEDLRKQVNNSYNKIYGDSKPISEISIDMEIEKIWANFFEDLEQLEPFGYKNPEPLFLMNNSKVETLKFFGNAVESFAGKTRNKNDLILDIIGYGLATNLNDLRFNNPQTLNLNIVGNIRLENTYNMRHQFLKYYLRDVELIEGFEFREEFNNYESNPILKEELAKVSKIEVIENHINEDKIAMFLPAKIKNASLIKKITHSLENKKKVIIVSSSNLTLTHTYNVVSSYLPDKLLYYNNKSRINNKTVIKENVIFITVPAFFHNLKLFNSEKFQIIVDEPYYSMVHPSSKNIIEFSEFKKYIIYKKRNIFILGTLFHASLKEYFKRAGFKVLVSNISNINYEVVRENKRLSEVINDYLKDNTTKIILINEKRKQEMLSKILLNETKNTKDNIKKYHNSYEFSKKILIRESFKNKISNLFISSYCNNGIGMEIKSQKPTFILLDVPKSRLELLDLVASWYSKKGKTKFVLAYDDKFKTRLSYEFSRIYPSTNILKQTYDALKENEETKEKDFISDFFQGDTEFAKTVLDELIDSGLIINQANYLKIIENFDLKLLHRSVKSKEGIVDKWITKEIIEFFEKLEIKDFMEFFKTDLSETKLKGV